MFSSWLRNLINRQSQTLPRRRRMGARRRTFSLILLEALEDRCLPATSLIGSALPAQQLTAAYGQLPLSFEANQGQSAAQVNFLARGPGYALFLTPGEAVLGLQKPAAAGATPGAATPAPEQDVVRMQLVGAQAAPQVLGLDPLSGTSNYLIGNDPSQWHTSITNYARVEYQGVYPGVDLVYYGNQGQLEYDFVVSPGANPGVIQLAFQSTEGMALDSQGNLLLHTAGGDVVEQAPLLYQENGGVRQAVSGQYVMGGNGQVGFAVGAYDTSRPLTIDPVLSYSTYLGGSSGEVAYGIAVDSAGNAYVTGETVSTDFPTTSGAFQTPFGGGADAFVTELNPSGTALVYSTYVGGSGTDVGTGIAVDSSGNAYFAGITSSTDFPTTTGAFQTQLGAGAGQNAFVAKLNASGTALLYSSYLGGSNYDQANGIAVDSSGNAYVTGTTTSTNFPTTAGAFQTTYRGGHIDAFVAQFNPTLSGAASLVYSTYLGGSDEDVGYGIAVDSSGDAYVSGSTKSTDFPTTASAFQTTFGGGYVGGTDAFVTKLNATGTALVYSTYLGGSLGGGSDESFGIAVDSAGDAHVTGQTTGGFPTTAGAFRTTITSFYQDAFVTELNASGTALVYSTYLGGSSDDGGFGIAMDSLGNAFVTGYTTSTDFPTTASAFQTTYGGGSDAFVTELNASGTALLYSTFLGGSSTDQGFGIAVDSSGSAYVAGYTESPNFPTTAGAVQTTLRGLDAIIAKINVAMHVPALTVTDAGQTYNGQPFPASATVNGGSSLEGVTPTLAYYVGTGTSGTLLAGAPLDAGTYTVVATFAGSADYTSASAQTTFTITPAAPLVTVSENGGIYNGQPFAASATASSTTVGATVASILVPAYFYPVPGGSPWDQLTAAAATTPIMAIMNPNSGPGAAADPNYLAAGQVASRGR